MRIKKISALLLAALLVFGLTGCIGNFYENAMTIDGREISSGLYLTAQYNAYSQAKSLVEDTETDILKQQVEGEKATDWIHAETMKMLREFVCVERMCREREITLNEENSEYLSQMMQYYDMSVDLYEENGIGRNSMMTLMASSLLKEQLFEDMYTGEDSLAPPDEELKARYEEEYGHIGYLMVSLNTADGATDYQDQVREITGGMLADIEAGEDYDTVTAAGVEEAYAVLGREFDDTTVENNSSTSYISYTYEEDGTYSEDFLNELKAQAEGERGIYEMSTMLLLYEKLPAFADDAEFEEMRAQVLQDLCADDFDAYLESLYNEYAVEEQPGAVAYFSPKKIVSSL